MANTILLDRTAWDLVLDVTGNIAVASEPYSQVQDVASACRVFQSEVYYDTSQGVPYFQQILGRSQPVQVLKARLVQRALTVPGVTAARAVLGRIVSRRLTGQVQITTAGGVQTVTL